MASHSPASRPASSYAAAKSTYTGSRPSTQHSQEPGARPQSFAGPAQNSPSRPQVRIPGSPSRPKSYQAPVSSSPGRGRPHSYHPGGAPASPSRPHSFQNTPSSPSRGRPQHQNTPPSPSHSQYHNGQASPSRPRAQFQNGQHAPASPNRGQFQATPPSPSRGRPQYQDAPPSSPHRKSQNTSASPARGRQHFQNGQHPSPSPNRVQYQNAPPPAPRSQSQNPPSSPARGRQPFQVPPPSPSSARPVYKPASPARSYAKATPPGSPAKPYARGTPPASPTRPYARHSTSASPNRNSYNRPGMPPSPSSYQAYQPPNVQPRPQSATRTSESKRSSRPQSYAAPTDAAVSPSVRPQSHASESKRSARPQSYAAPSDAAVSPSARPQTHASKSRPSARPQSYAAPSDAAFTPSARPQSHASATRPSARPQSSAAPSDAAFTPSARPQSYAAPSVARSGPSVPTPTNSHAPKPFLPFGGENTNAPTYEPKSITNLANNPPPPKAAPMAPYVHLDYHTNPEDHKNRFSHEVIIPFSKRTMKFIRMLAVTLRAMQLLAGLGVVVMLLFIRSMGSLEGWLCRVPPGVALLHIIYNIYHLSSSSSLRIPTSSKVYHLFALTLDLAVCAFTAFIAVLTWKQHATKLSWKTTLNDDKITVIMVLTMFITVCVLGGLSLIMAMLEIWFIYAFRVLARLPPDLNPWVVEQALTVKKRWSALSEEGLSARSPAEKPRAMPFVASRTRAHIPAPPSEGKYAYSTLNVTEADVTDQLRVSHPEPERDQERSSFEMGDDKALLKDDDSASSWESGPPQRRQSRVAEMGTKIRSLKIRKEVRSPISVGGGKVQGFSKQALLGTGDGQGPRFRKVSSEAH